MQHGTNNPIPIPISNMGIENGFNHRKLLIGRLVVLTPQTIESAHAKQWTHQQICKMVVY